MNRKASIIALAGFVIGAVILGFLFLNKGDGPVMQVMIADKPAADVTEFEKMKSSDDQGVWILWEKEFNQFIETRKAWMPAGKDIYANVHFVESPKGSILTAKWVSEGNTVKEDGKELTTNQQGVISYLLEGSVLKSGDYTLEIYSEGNKLFEYAFSVK